MIEERYGGGYAAHAGHGREITVRVFEVEELALHIGLVLGGDPYLQDVWLRGEVSDLSRSPAGHYYFCLRDETSRLRCVLFRGHAGRSAVLPSVGAALVAHGTIEFYPKGGTVQLLVDLLLPEGMGLAQMQFEMLYRRLEAEGLFDAGRKRPLPAYPRCIGIVTSDGGAVIHDLLTVFRRRYPLARVVFVPTPVQGAAAAPALVAALRLLNALPPEDAPDVAILARGGGSAEDLATFNDERLVRAIFGSRLPVVSAVGHETDITLADLVADLRAPTPSAAAEMITPDLEAVRADVAGLRERVGREAAAHVGRARAQCDAAREALRGELGHRVRLAREQVAGRRLQLQALSPNRTLGRGYAVAERAGADGTSLLDAGELSVGETLAVRLHRGHVQSEVTAVHGAAKP